MSTHQARVDAGVPAGGQFTTSQRAEAGIALDDPADLDGLADAFLAAADSDDAAERAAVEEAISNAYDSARHWEARKGVRERSRGVVEVDDIAQEALLAVLERQANGGTVHDVKGYMHTSAWGIANQAGNTAVRQENRKALKLFNTEVDRRVAALGRPLTSVEQDQIAADIRENWHDPRRKPSVDFRRYAGQMEVSMDAQESADAAGYLTPASTLGRPGEDNPFEVRPGSALDRALDAVEGHAGDRRDARRMLWNALAENSDGAPMVDAGTLSQRKVTAARAVMKSHRGGVAGAIRDYENGRTNQAVDALFAPWGENVSPSQKAAVVAQMNRFRERAEDLWDSALKLANTRNSERV